MFVSLVGGGDFPKFENNPDDVTWVIVEARSLDISTSGAQIFSLFLLVTPPTLWSVTSNLLLRLVFGSVPQSVLTIITVVKH